MAGYLVDVQRSRTPATARTYAAHCDTIAAFLGPRLSDLPADVLTRETLADLWAWLGREDTTTRRGARSTTARNAVVATLQRVWRWADERSDHDVPRAKRIDLPEPPSDPTTAPTWAQIDAFLGRLDGDRWRLAFLLRGTGLRVGQALRLLWSDVDLAAGELTVRGALGKSRQERRGRVVPLSPVVVREMAGWGTRDGALVTLTRSRLYDGLHEAWAAAGYTDAERSPWHALRRGFVSGLRALGADPDAVEYLVGHSAGVAGIYTASWALRLREAVEMVPEVGAAEAVVRLRREGSRGRS